MKVLFVITECEKCSFVCFERA